MSLLKTETIFSLLQKTGIGGDWYEALLAICVTVLAGALLVYFLGTRLGLSIRATGNNIDMVRAPRSTRHLPLQSAYASPMR